MANRTADVNLTIRAKTDGEKNVAELASVIDRLLKGAGAGAEDIAELGRAIGALDKSAAALVTAQERTAANATRQAAAIHSANAAVAEQRARVETLTRGLGILQAEANKAFIGPRRAGLVDTIRATKNELADAERQLARFGRAADTNLAALRTSRSSLLGLQSTGRTVGESQSEARAHIESLRQEAEAVDKLNEAHGHSNAATKLGAFGLKPYELQNLVYQIDDVATQLASGTSLARTLGQQGGQIVQIFPRITSAIIGAFSNPVFLGAAAVLGGIVLALKEAGDQAERLRGFSASLSFRPDGASYDAGTLAKQAEALHRLGASAKDSVAAVNTLVDTGVAADAISGLGKAAHETAVRLGQSLPDAAKVAAEAFTGGYDAVAAFDDKLNFLTASEREHIRALFDSGHAEAARTEARLAYQRTEDGIAAKSRGPWGEAALSLGKAWHALLDTIANSAPIKVTIGVLAELAGAVKGVGDAITGALGDGKPATSAVAARIGQVQTQIRDLKKEIADYEAAIAKKSPIAGTLQHLVDVSKQQLAAAEVELGRLEKSAPDTVNGSPNSPEAKKRADELRQISREDELQRLRDAGQARVLTATEKARRAELAGIEAARSANDAAVAAAERRRAVAHETAEIEKESDARAKTAAAEREREIKAFEGRVIGAEGGAGKNPHSTAKGYGQFTDETFLSQFGKVFPGQTDLPRDQILALRNDQQVAKAVIDNYARENAKLLESFGAKVTAGNLYLAHFLGAGGARAILTAPDSKPVDQIIAGLPRAAKILSGNQGYLRADDGKGRYRTAAELRTFIAGRVSETGQQQTDGQEAITKLIEDSKKRQDEFNLSIRHGNEDRARALDGLRAEDGLYGKRLIAEQRAQTIAQAVLDLKQKTETTSATLKPGETPVVLSEGQIAATKEMTGALFDAQHASEALNASLADVQRPVDELTAQRDLLKQQAEFLRSIGDNTQADKVDEQIRSLGTSIGDAYNKLIEFYRALSPDQQVQLGIIDQAQLDNVIDKLKQAKQASQEWGKVAGLSAQTVAQTFASSASSAFTNFINKVASGKNVFKAFGEGIREFAANFLSYIAQMIVQLLAFMAAVQILRALGVPIPASAFGSVHHAGGIAGSAGGVKRSVDPMLFAGALRYHTGGIAGLAPNEVPAILKRGEEVLTEGDPRHRANGGLGGGQDGAMPAISIVNTFDKEEAAEMLLRTRSGERAFLNYISANSRAVKAALA